MGQKLALLAGIAIGFTLARLLRRESHRRPASLPVDPRAFELRRRLDTVRTQEAEEPGGPVLAAEAPQELEAELDEARRGVYEEGRATIEEMRGAEGPPS